MKQSIAHIALVVRDYDFIKRTISNGTIGFGEGYMAGEWDTPDLSVLLEVLAQIYERDFTTKGTGSGIGLYVARALVEMHQEIVAVAFEIVANEV